MIEKQTVYTIHPLKQKLCCDIMIFLQGSIGEGRNGWLNGEKGDVARVSSDIMENINTNLCNVRGMNSMVLEYIK